uniref:TBP2 n=1 Tax=Arundo donax TaxID=35708 RepID=A0A0A9D0K6_ARUDO
MFKAIFSRGLGQVKAVIMSLHCTRGSVHCTSSSKYHLGSSP